MSLYSWRPLHDSEYDGDSGNGSCANSRRFANRLLRTRTNRKMGRISLNATISRSIEWNRVKYPGVEELSHDILLQSEMCGGK